MIGVLRLFTTLALCQGLTTSSIQHVQRIIDAVRNSPNYLELVKDLPPTLAEYLLTSISPKHKEKPIKSAYDFVVDLTRPTDIYDTLKAYPLSFPLGKAVYDNKTKEKL